MSQSSIWIYCVLYFLKARDVASIYLKKKIDKFDKIQELPNNGGLTAPPHPAKPLLFFCIHFTYWLATPLIIIG